MAANRKAEVETAQKSFDFAKNKYQLQLETNMGTMLLDMWADVAPGHVNNLLGLAKIGYYDGVTFHRIIPQFMIQGGCPDGRGTGGPGYTIKAEFNDKQHEAGVLSMARTSDPNSGGSQFFICLARVPHLDRQYTAFGKLANKESLDVLSKIGAVATDGNDKPLKPVTITKATVLETPA